MKRSKRVCTQPVLAGLTLLALLTGCASMSEHPPPSPDYYPEGGIVPVVVENADAGDAGRDGGDGGTDGGTVDCAKGTQLANVVPQNIVAGTTPPATGGTVVPGTYLLTAISYYGGPLGPTGLNGQYTIVVTPGQFVITGIRVVGTISPTDAVKSTTQSFTQTGNQLSFGLVCPQTAAFPTALFYSATATELVLYKGPTDTEVYTRQ